MFRAESSSSICFVFIEISTYRILVEKCLNNGFSYSHLFCVSLRKKIKSSYTNLLENHTHLYIHFFNFIYIYIHIYIHF